MILPTMAILALSANAAAIQQAPTAGKSAPVVAHEPTITSEIFVTDATMSGLFEIEAGKVALARSSNPQVRDFAQRMVAEHTAAGVELREVVLKLSYTIPVAMLLDAEHQAKLKKLQDASGRKFDAAYGEAMREGHAHAVRTFTLASSETLVDATLRDFAGKKLPLLQSHHALAEKLPRPDKD